MHVLLILDRKLSKDDFNRLRKLLKHLHVVADYRFEEAVKAIKTGDYRLVVFVTFDDHFPGSWKIHDIEINVPVMTLFKVNKLDLLLFYSFLDSIELLSRKSTVHQKALANMHPLLYKSLEFIEENIHDNDLTLEKVASSIYVSRCHYSRMFKAYIGTGFKDYIMNKRIQRAKIMLQEGQSVTDACFAVGYGDLTHFSRVFKRIVGSSPSAYKGNNHRYYSYKKGGDV